MAAAAREARQRRRGTRAPRVSPASAPAAESSATGTANEPVARSASSRAGAPSSVELGRAATPPPRARPRRPAPLDRLQLLDDGAQAVRVRRHRASRLAHRYGPPMRDPDCLFCKIVAGEIPATRVREDERTIAFMDINPATRGHLLVIPREHATDLLEIGEEDLAACAAAAQALAQQARTARGRRREPAQLVRARRPGRPSSTSTCT